jgi:hypothetical protein
MDLAGHVQGGVTDPRYVKREVDFAFSKEEARVNDALEAALAVPAEFLRARDAAGYTPRFGFMMTQPGIIEALGTARHAGPDARMDYSGSYGSYSGTSRPGLGMM